MNLEEQIASAVGAHGLWKGRLRAAVESGVTDVPVEVARDDRQCGFGRWLHGARVDEKARRSSHYATCMELHRRFHQAAAEVLSLAVAGKKQEASKALAPDREFTRASIDLTRAMLAWQGSQYSQARK